MLNINKYNLNNFMTSRHVTSRHVFYFKLYQKLCLYNLFIIRKIFSFFFDCYSNGGKSSYNFVNIQKFNRKNIFALFGKFIDRLYKQFLFAKSIYLFKYFERGG